MVFIPGGNFEMGGDNEEARSDEFPKHQVTVSSFWMDITEVTNAEFQKFIDETGYITTAERKIDWDEIKTMLPPGTPKPHDSLLSPASLVFKETSTSNLNDYSKRWSLIRNANWKQPFGPQSDIVGKDNYPVVHVSWEDANEYCKWAGKRLPTEAEFEYASRAGMINNVYSWGNEKVDDGMLKANTWEGEFPNQNNVTDKFYYAAPVKSFKPNNYGLYDLAGNVWEWCLDYYSDDLGTTAVVDPEGPASSSDGDRTLRGGSYSNYAVQSRSAVRARYQPENTDGVVGFRIMAK